MCVALFIRQAAPHAGLPVAEGMLVAESRFVPGEDGVFGFGAWPRLSNWSVEKVIRDGLMLRKTP